MFNAISQHSYCKWSASAWRRGQFLKIEISLWIFKASNASTSQNVNISKLAVWSVTQNYKHRNKKVILHMQKKCACLKIRFNLWYFIQSLNCLKIPLLYLHFTKENAILKLNQFTTSVRNDTKSVFGWSNYRKCWKW